MRFAQVIPLQRTPLGVEHFDYRIPDELDVKIGSLVSIPFRRGKSVGLVESLMTDSPVANKALTLNGTYADIRLPESLVRLLAWTAGRTFCSKPTILKAWLRSVPKKPIIPTLLRRPTNRNDTLQTHWTLNPTQQLLDRARQAVAHGQRILIITPWKARAERLHQELAGSLLLHSDLNDGQAFHAWSSFVNGTYCLITTRLGAWLAPCADLVLLDEPENDDHKQDELSPRYDARLMLAWCQKNAGISLESFGLTPPLHVQSDAPPIPVNLSVQILQKGGSSRIPMIQSDTLERLREHTGPIVIYHPIRGWIARLVCRDCGWRASCDHCGFGLRADQDHALCPQCGKKYPLPLTCPSCGGTELNKSFPGIEKLKQIWAREEPDIPAIWRTLSNEDVEAPLPQEAMVLVTDGRLLSGATEDIRRKERQCIYFRRLADRVALVGGHLIIQCDESEAIQWSEWLSTKDVQEFQEQEREQRRLFEYPPSIRLIKILVKGDLQKLNAENLKLKASLRGPFPVAFRPKSRKPEHIYHLLFRTHVTEKELITMLTPLASSAIIDLDPVAFFK